MDFNDDEDNDFDHDDDVLVCSREHPSHLRIRVMWIIMMMRIMILMMIS